MGTHTQRKKAWSLALSPLFWFLRAARPSTVRAADARSAGSLLSCIDTKYMMFSLLLHIFLCSTSCAGLLIGVLLAHRSRHERGFGWFMYVYRYIPRQRREEQWWAAAA